MRPQYSVNDYLYEIWPYDSWSRKLIQDYANDLSLIWTEVPTTMGTNALKFEPVDYKNLISFLKEL